MNKQLESKDYRRGYAAGNAAKHNGKLYKVSSAEIDDILVKVWNDIVNRQAGKILFKETLNILDARDKIIEIFTTKEV